MDAASRAAIATTPPRIRRRAMEASSLTARTGGGDGIHKHPTSDVTPKRAQGSSRVTLLAGPSGGPAAASVQGASSTSRPASRP